jgi:streptogramin lyase
MRFLSRPRVFRTLSVAALLFALAVPLLTASSSAAVVIKITETPLLPVPEAPQGITVGADHNLWLTLQQSNSIGRLTSAGALTRYSLPVTDTEPMQNALGPDGAVWFAEYGPHSKIGRITTTGVITEYTASLTAGVRTWSVAAGPDGNMWYTEFNNHAIGRMSPTGTSMVEFSTPMTTSFPTDITLGPDSAMWFSEQGGDRIGRITTSAPISITEYQLAAGTAPIGIAVGPDGNIWFAEAGSNKVGKMTITGTLVAEYPLLTKPITGTVGPVELVAGPDRQMWVVGYGANIIASVSMTGTVKEYPVPTANSKPNVIIMGPDGKLQFTEEAGDKVGTITLGLTYLPLLYK